MARLPSEFEIAMEYKMENQKKEFDETMASLFIFCISTIQELIRKKPNKEQFPFSLNAMWCYA